jgi:hypothetical protein
MICVHGWAADPASRGFWQRHSHICHSSFERQELIAFAILPFATDHDVLGTYVYALLLISSSTGAVSISMTVRKAVTWTDRGNGTTPSAIEFDFTRFPYPNSEN